VAASPLQAAESGRKAVQDAIRGMESILTRFRTRPSGSSDWANPRGIGEITN